MTLKVDIGFGERLVWMLPRGVWGKLSSRCLGFSLFPFPYAVLYSPFPSKQTMLPTRQ